MNRKPFQSLKVIVYCKECDKEHHFYSVVSYRLTRSCVSMANDSSYSPPANGGWSQDTLDMQKCLGHTKGNEVIDHYDRKVILLKKVEN